MGKKRFFQTRDYSRTSDPADACLRMLYTSYLHDAEFSDCHKHCASLLTLRVLIQRGDVAVFA